MSCVLVLDGRSRATLQIVRSLGRKGVCVYVGNEHWACSSFFSKYTRKRLIYPDPKTAAFRDCIFEFLRKHDVDMIIPVRDDTTLFCAKYQDELNQLTRTFVADYETIMLGRDKALTFEAAEKEGIPCPRTQVATNAQEVLKADVGFPLILKPAMSSGSRGLYKVENRHHLQQLSETIFVDYDKYLVQEFIPTQENVVGANIFFSECSESIAVFTYERLRDYPRGNGPSVLRQSTDNRQVKDVTLQLFAGLKWKGVAMAEYKIDSRDGTPKLMEINPRFWGSLALPVFSGVDFPWLLYQTALGKKVKPVRNYRLGVKARWLLLGDLLWMATSKHLLADLKEFTKFSGKDLTYDIVSWMDPLPALGAMLEGIQFIINPKKRRHALNRGNQ